MPKQLPADFSAQLLKFIAERQRPVSVDELASYFRDKASKRSIQRRLAELVAEQSLVTIGEARALQYQLKPAANTTEIVPQDQAANAETEARLPLSPAAAELRRLISVPAQQRTPVGYNHEFLDRYRPNETFYLTEPQRQELHRLGRTPDAERPAGTYARNMLQRLLIDLSWASSKLEGNTYSLLDTEKLLNLGESVAGKDANETQMLLNHKEAIEYLVEAASEGGLSSALLRNVHALLANNLLPDPAACGRLRNTAVGIGGSVFHPLEVGSRIAEYFQQIVDTAAAIQDPFEQSFFLMVQLPYLQPFDDVNKRVSRLAANIPLIQKNLCPLSFIDVPEQDYIDGTMAVYELNRIELLRDVYLWAYQRSCQRYVAVRQSLGEPDPFRLRYRNQLIAVVGSIVRRCAEQSPAEIRVTAAAAGISGEHLEHFVRVVQQELMALHEGNYARFRLRPSEFQAWRIHKESAKP